MGEEEGLTKIEVKYFTKDAAVTELMKRASAPNIETIVADGIVDRYIIHLLTKPFKGGTPAIENEPIRADMAVTGMAFHNPPSLFRSLKPVFLLTLSAVRNKRLLKVA